MRGEEVRKRKILKEIEIFLEEDNKKKTKSIVVSANESVMIKQYLYERDAQVEVVNEISLKGKVSFTLRKM